MRASAVQEAVVQSQPIGPEVVIRRLLLEAIREVFEEVELWVVLGIVGHVTLNVKLLATWSAAYSYVLLA